MIYKKNDQIKQYIILDSFQDKILYVRDSITDKKEYIFISNSNINFNTTPKVFPEIIDTFNYKGNVFLVQEELIGMEMDEVLEELGPLDIQLVVEWAKDICLELKFMAEINEKYGYWEVLLSNTILTSNYCLKFAEGYNIEKFEKLNLKKSLISIGRWMNELLSGQQDFLPIRNIDPTFSYTLQGIIDRCLQGEFKSFEELYQALSSYESIDKIVYAGNKLLKPNRKAKPMSRNGVNSLSISDRFYKLKNQNNDVNDNAFHDVSSDTVTEKQILNETEPFHSSMNNQAAVEEKKGDSDEKNIKNLSSKKMNFNEMESDHPSLKNTKKHFSFLDEIPLYLKFIVPMAVVSLGIVVGINLHKWNLNKKYENHIQISAHTTSKSEAIKECKRAISLCPGRTEAYEQLLILYSEDAVFTAEEEKEFLKEIHRNWDDVKKNSEYGFLAYQIGRTYWYYYNYGTDIDNEITRMKSAIQWFQDSLQYKNTKKVHTIAKIYCEIGKFNKNVIMNVETGEDQGMYKKYFDNLSQLMTIEKSNIVSKLELYKLIITSVDTYKNNFIADGIEESEINAIRQKAMKNAKEIYPNTEKSKKLQESILQMN